MVQVLVIGGGHAGTEAALAAARLGAQTMIISQSFAQAGALSCNPAIGGLGKGHLVREIDAMGGVMGLAADASCIQFRLLNRSKGPAVRGPRAQVSRKKYKTYIQRKLKETPGLSFLEGEVTRILYQGTRITGVETAAGDSIKAQALVVTTGTFLNGMIHRGSHREAAGRLGEKPANGLKHFFDALALPMGRLKTGTPPRLDGRTINWACCTRQKGDDPPGRFSFVGPGITGMQTECAITRTNPRTHRIITENLDKSAVYGGAITQKGPRYCPSIEDKVVRFPQRESHQIFLEPEEIEGVSIYPNGISTSLEASVQQEFVRSIAGCEKAHISAYGYAIAYDYLDPRALQPTLALSGFSGLYFAGQINGTTGYEEAAAQGLLAGANAALYVRGAPSLQLSRTQSYIGVMVDDLTRQGVKEPYRMFTSRAEYRLSLRADNADERLTETAAKVGLVDRARLKMFHVKQEEKRKAKDALSAVRLSPQQAHVYGAKVNLDGKRRNLVELMAGYGLNWSAIQELVGKNNNFATETVAQIVCDATYAPYIERQRADMKLYEEHRSIALPKDLNFRNIAGLSHEIREKLEQERPQNLAQVFSIDGMTPAAVSCLLVHLRRAG